MKYCFNCGNKLIKNSKYCDKCGSKVVDNNNEKGENNDWLVYIIIWVVLVFCSIFINNFSFIFLALRLIVVITAKIKYPKVLFINIIFWIELLFSIYYFVMMVLAFIMCNELIDGCSTLGRILFL